MYLIYYRQLYRRKRHYTLKISRLDSWVEHLSPGLKTRGHSAVITTDSQHGRPKGDLTLRSAYRSWSDTTLDKARTDSGLEHDGTSGICGGQQHHNFSEHLLSTT